MYNNPKAFGLRIWEQEVAFVGVDKVGCVKGVVSRAFQGVQDLPFVLTLASLAQFHYLSFCKHLSPSLSFSETSTKLSSGPARGKHIVQGLSSSILSHPHTLETCFIYRKQPQGNVRVGDYRLRIIIFSGIDTASSC